MDKYRNVFQKKKVFLPVVHVQDYEQAITNTEVALQCGADGVFLINQYISPENFMQIYDKVRAQLPETWLGINLLGVSLLHIFNYGVDSANGIWVDDSRVALCLNNISNAPTIFNKHRETWNGLYFGGVAFKYTQGYSENPEVCSGLAKASLNYVDVVTTSGPGTDKPPPPEKLRAMKEAIGDSPLANASGVGIENISEFLDSVDCFLVASKISIDDFTLDPVKTRELGKIIHNAA